MFFLKKYGRDKEVDGRVGGERYLFFWVENLNNFI
jgi:hypothetical protein